MAKGLLHRVLWLTAVTQNKSKSALHSTEMLEPIRDTGDKHSTRMICQTGLLPFEDVIPLVGEGISKSEAQMGPASIARAP